jgi:hypothetical protein
MASEYIGRFFSIECNAIERVLAPPFPAQLGPAEFSPTKLTPSAV